MGSEHTIIHRLPNQKQGILGKYICIVEGMAVNKMCFFIYHKNIMTNTITYIYIIKKWLNYRNQAFKNLFGFKLMIILQF